MNAFRNGLRVWAGLMGAVAFLLVVSGWIFPFGDLLVPIAFVVGLVASRLERRSWVIGSALVGSLLYFTLLAPRLTALRLYDGFSLAYVWQALWSGWLDWSWYHLVVLSTCSALLWSLTFWPPERARSLSTLFRVGAGLWSVYACAAVVIPVLKRLF